MFIPNAYIVKSSKNQNGQTQENEFTLDKRYNNILRHQFFLKIEEIKTNLVW